MANKITVLLDLVTDKAQASARGFKASIAEAEGAVGKFKAGASSAFASLGVSAGTLAVGAGGAIAGFAAKSVAAFQETALAAGKLSDATGLTVQDASRLQEVARDLNVNTDALAGSLVKMEKAVSSNSSAVKELGVQTQRTKEGQVDVNAEFLDTIAKLGTVTDANKKAELASQIFGRGFADSAELILGNADEITKRLKEVSDAQVITPEKLARAKEFRDQMDSLADSLKQVEITVGGAVVPVIGDLAEGLSKATTAAQDLKTAIGKVPGGNDFTDTLFAGFPQIADQFVSHLRTLEEGLGFTPQVDKGKLADIRQQFDDIVARGNAVNGVVDAQGAAVAELGPRWAAATIPLEAASGAFAEMQRPLEGVTQAAQDAIVPIGDVGRTFHDMVDEVRQSNADLKTEVDKLRGTIDLGGQLDDITSGFDDITAAAKDMADKVDGSGRKFRDAVRRQQLQLLDLLDTFKNIPAEKRSKIIAEIATGDLDKLNQALDDIIGKDRFVHVGLIMPNVQQAFSGVNIAPASAGAPTPIFQNPNPQPAAVNNSQTTIIYPVGTTPTGVTVDRRLYDTRNGTSPR